MEIMLDFIKHTISQCGGGDGGDKLAMTLSFFPEVVLYSPLIKALLGVELQ
jgi:hypothetical protein